MSVIVHRAFSVFPGKIGGLLHDEADAAVPGFLGLEAHDGLAEVHFHFENELDQDQEGALDAAIAAHDPPTSMVEDAIAGLGLD